MTFYYPEISSKVVTAAYKVHTALGPGLLESTYEAVLEYELKQQGLYVERQKKLPLIYETVELTDAYRLDLLVENKIIIELKSVESLHEVHYKQILTYLRLSKMKVGYLVNFNVSRLKGHIHRKVY
ncbi:MAG: GxxExxY protein [Saprospiraceae bacterium]